MRSFKYTNSKGDSINIGPNSVPTTLDDNIGSYWNANTLPDIPDGSYTYKNNTWATVDSWTANVSGPLTVSGGKLIISAGQQYAYRSLASLGASTGQAVRISVQALVGGYACSFITSPSFSLVAQTKTLALGETSILDAIIPTGATALYFGNGNNSASFAISVIYIGDGTYSTKLIDIFGDWNFLNVYGCTPVAGSNGKALSFNGINNYLRSSNTLTSVPDVWRFHIRFPFGLAQNASKSYICSYGVAGGAKLGVVRISSSDALTISYYTGAADTGVAFASFFTGYTNSSIDLGIEVNFTASAIILSDGTTLPASSVRVYRNGIVFGTQSITTPAKPVAGGYLYIGSYNSTLYFLSAIAEGFAIGSGALTAAEHWALYSNYSSPFKATGESSYGIVESVEGIDYADSDLQTTKAPYQDGKTYLDTLLSSRDITIEGIIPVATAIDTINANRKAMLDVLNAKYGTGTLDYYYGLNTIQHKVLKNVTVDSVRFANRVMPEPTQRYQITFTAHDPYFYDPTFSPYAIEILSGNSATLVVGGENNTPCFIRIYGAATNPTITNTTTGETLSLTYSLAGGSYIDIDTTFGNKSVKLNGSTNLIGYVDLTSTFFQLSPSSTVLSYSGGGYIIVTWYNRYIGV